MFGDLNADARGTAWLIDCDENARPIALRYVEADPADPLAGRLVIQNDESQPARVEVRLADLVGFLGDLVGVDVLGLVSTFAGGMFG